MNDAPTPPRCEACGAVGAVAFDGATLCVDCYAERGSSCAGEREPPVIPPESPSL